jgi:hypothetical protein
MQIIVWVWVWVLCYDRWSVGQSVLEYNTQLGLATRFLITLWQLRVCWYEAFSLTRGRVCHLQLLLALANAVILGSEPLGTRDHILLSQIRDFPFRRLLRLAGLRWRYSTPPWHGVNNRQKQNICYTQYAFFKQRWVNSLALKSSIICYITCLGCF